MTVHTGDDVLVALTMTPEAAGKFWSALVYAAARIKPEARKHADDEMSHTDWQPLPESEAK